MHIRKAALAVVALISLTASAENRFCIGGDLDHLSAVAKTVCQAKLNAVRLAAQANASMDHWHLVVVCDEVGWTDYAALSTRPAGQLEDAIADTDLQRQSIFFRGSRLDASVEAAARLIAVETKGSGTQPSDAYGTPTMELASNR